MFVAVPVQMAQVVSQTEQEQQLLYSEVGLRQTVASPGNVTNYVSEGTDSLLCVLV